MPYKTVLTEDDTPLQIEINDDSSRWNGVIFNFTKVAIKETWFGNCKIKFEHEVIEDPFEALANIKHRDKQEFLRYIGDVLLELVVESNENRDPDTPKSFEQRRIRQESPPPSANSIFH